MQHIKRYFKGFYMSLGMFCGIPLPFHIWDEEYTPIMISCFPLVGLIIGVIWWLVALLLISLNVPLMLTVALLTLTPFFVAGFIHLDGYMDTNDALLSRRSIEERLRILIDSRVGAFAVVMLVVLFLLQFSAMYEVVGVGRYLKFLIGISIISRCCSSFSIFSLRHMPQSNYAQILKKNINMSNKIFVVIVALITLISFYFYAGFLSLAVFLAVILGYAFAIRRVSKSFNGISGDLLGYALVISELFGLITLAILQERWM